MNIGVKNQKGITIIKISRKQTIPAAVSFDFRRLARKLKIGLNIKASITPRTIAISNGLIRKKDTTKRIPKIKVVTTFLK
tara:strand:+ start:108 stop:347 length:240 start_codon:yes stop_codon:yes gene_type:complete